MNSETLCEICTNMISIPTVLTCCSLSVCLDCLRKITTKDMKRLGKPYYRCPSCNREQQVLAAVRPNVFLARYIEFSYKKGKLQNITCGHCQTPVKAADTTICSACEYKHLCKTCSITIHSLEQTKNHVRTNLGTALKNYAGSLNKAMLCPSHVTEKLEFICLRDFVTCCKACVPNHKKACKEPQVYPFE